MESGVFNSSCFRLLNYQSSENLNKLHTPRSTLQTHLNVVHPRCRFVLPSGEAPLGGKAGETLLAQGFVHHDGYGIGQIQAPGVRPHGNAHAPVVHPLQQGFRQALGFAAEDQEIIGAVGRLSTMEK